MDRRDWLLLFLALPLPNHPTPPALDPLRVMKGMFLLAQGADLPHAQAYQFLPYLYGPCSFEIYHDLDGLVAAGLVAAEQPWGRSWHLYTPTAHGHREAEHLRGQVPRAALDTLREIKQYVAFTPYRRLLRDVYRQYPEYATQSVLTLR